MQLKTADPAALEDELDEDALLGISDNEDNGVAEELEECNHRLLLRQLHLRWRKQPVLRSKTRPAAARSRHQKQPLQ